jgi:hypothetical protein
VLRAYSFADNRGAAELAGTFHWSAGACQHLLTGHGIVTGDVVVGERQTRNKVTRERVLVSDIRV